MKKFKRIIATVMTLAMIVALGVGITASAVGPGSITINAPGNITLTNQTFNAYQIFELKISTDTTGAIDGHSYNLNDDFSGFLVDYPAYGASEAVFIDWLYDASRTTEDLNGLATDLKTFIDDASPAIGATATATNTTSGAKSVKIDAVPYGYYLVTGDGNEAASIHTLVTVPGENASHMPIDDVVINIKADAPAIDKEVWYHGSNDPNDGPSGSTDAGWGDWTDVNIGDTVYFKHESKVPAMLGYEYYWFIVRDSMSKGLTLDDTKFAITVDGRPLTNWTVTNDRDDVSDIIGDGYDYVVVIDGDEYDGAATYTDPTNFAIYFNPETFVGYTQGAAIIITYEAMLNGDAVIGAPGNPNIVYLEYSNNPYDTGNGDYNDEPGDTDDTPEDEVVVYTFDIDIYKYTGTLGSGEKALADAVFELRTDANDDGTAIEFVDLTGGNYRVATEDDTTSITTALVSPGSGKISIIGLDAGTYYLVETEAPTGYNKLDVAIEVVIEHDDGEGAYTVNWGVSETGPVNVENNTGTEFPGTGGIGRTIFIVIGLTMMVGAIVTLSVRRKVARAVR